MMRQFCEQEGIPMDVPYKKLKKSQQADLKYGVKDGRSFKFTYTPMSGTGTRTVDTVFEGVITNMERRYNDTGSDYTKEVMRQYMVEHICPACQGQRLNPTALSVRVGDLNIAQATKLRLGSTKNRRHTTEITMFPIRAARSRISLFNCFC